MKLTNKEIDIILHRAQYEKTKLNSHGRIFYYIKAFPHRQSEEIKCQDQFNEYDIVDDELSIDINPTPIEDPKIKLGNELFRLVSIVNSSRAGKITGMLMELGDQELENIMNSTTLLKIKINESLLVLKESGVEIDKKELDPVFYLEEELKGAQHLASVSEHALKDMENKLNKHLNDNKLSTQINQELKSQEFKLNEQINQLKGNLNTAMKIMEENYAKFRIEEKKCELLRSDVKSLSLSIEKVTTKDIYCQTISNLIDMGILSTCKPQQLELNWLKRLVKLKDMKSKSINKLFKEGDNVPLTFSTHLQRFLNRLQESIGSWDEENVFTLDD